MFADYLNILFIYDNPTPPHSAGGFSYDSLTDAEKSLYNALQDGIYLAQQQIPIPVNFTVLNKYAALNSVDFERWEIYRFPAVRFYAQYPEGKEAYYNVQRGRFDTAVDMEPTDIKKRVLYMYRGEFGEPSILCQIFPPLCSLGVWAWLAISAAAAYKTATARTTGGRIIWGTGTALALNEFKKRGGFDELQSGDTSDDKQKPVTDGQ